MFLLLQSILMSGAMAFVASVILGRFGTMPLHFAGGIGLLVGLLLSYPTIAVLARADGKRFTFDKWLGICLAVAALAVTMMSVF